MIPPYSRTVANVWKPTVPVQPGSIVASSLVSQPIPLTSQILVQQPIFQPIQAQVNMIQPLQVASLIQPTPLISSTYQALYTQPFQGNLQLQQLGHAIPEIQLGQNAYGMQQTQPNPHYVGMVQNPIGK